MELTVGKIYIGGGSLNEKRQIMDLTDTDVGFVGPLALSFSRRPTLIRVPRSEFESWINP